MRAIRKFSLTLSAVAILLLLAVALTSVGANSRFPQSSAPKPSARAAVAQTMKTYTMYSGFWRTDGSFVSTIRIKNVLVVAPLDVTPVLFMADGTPYMLPSMHVPVSGVVTVSVNDALASAPQSVASHVSQFGSVSLMWSYSSPGHVSAQVAAIDASRSLSYTYSFMEPMAMPGHDTKQVLEGLWWKRDSGVTGFVTLTNTTDHQQAAALTPVHPGKSADSQQVILAPHSAQMLTLEALDANASSPDNRAGGIRVEYEGSMGAILVNGGLANESEGYSANVPFWFHDMSSAPSTSITYASAGLMVGKPDPMMMPGFPKDTVFSPYLALRNTTEKPLDVSLQVNYMTGMGMEGSMPITKSLTTQHLAPFEARHLDLQGPLAAAGLKNFRGAINLSESFTGKAGDLVLATGSVDQTGTYVFEVKPQGTGSSNSKYSNYWGVANGNDTMFTLWNPTDSAQDIVATFYYADGSGKYNLPVHLEPQASTMIDMAMLIMDEKPDAEGNVVPMSIREGSAQFASAKGAHEKMTVVIAAGVFNVTTATCGEVCTNCCGDSTFGISPSSFFCPIGESMQCASTAVNCAGTEVYPSSWSSSNSSVMTVSSGGLVNGVAVGSATITATFAGVIVYNGQFCVGENMPDNCPTGSPTGNASGDTVPQIKSFSPTWGQVGTTVPVTINGTGFGTAGTVVFSGTGISIATYGTRNDSTVVANFVIAAGASVGFQSFTVQNNSTSDGSTPQSNSVNFQVTPAVATPVNYHIVSESNLNDGSLFFTYTWSSSTGTQADLYQCSVGESVYYPNYPSTPYVWPLPMVQSSINPTVLSGSATNQSSTDTNFSPGNPPGTGYSTPYSASTPFNATQRWWWSCSNYNNNATQTLYPDQTITRRVFKDSDGFWKFQITKSGYTNTVKLPNQ